MNENKAEKIENNDTGPRAFAVLLQKIADGDAHTQLSEDLQSLIRVMTLRAREQVKSVTGSLSFTMNFSCDEKGMLNLSYAIKKTEPQPKRAVTVFWSDRNGNMTEQNPRQIELGLRDVSTKKNDSTPREPVAAVPAARDA